MSAPSTAHDHLRYVQNNTVALVGCPSTAGQGKGGVEHGPDALVRAGLPAQLRGLGWDVEFTGQQDFAALATPAAVAQDADMGKMKKPRTVSAITRHVAAVVAAHAQQGKVPVTLGGDHSLVRRLSSSRSALRYGTARRPPFPANPVCRPLCCLAC